VWTWGEEGENGDAVLDLMVLVRLLCSKRKVGENFFKFAHRNV
jgi:hypothetical protein